MDHRISFLRLGHSMLAYSTMGAGPLLVFPPPALGHLERELENPSMRSFYEAMASKFTLVRYDRLGTGMSDRERPPETLNLAFEIDVLEALVAELGTARVNLFGFGYGASVAAGLAARRRESVNRLLMMGSSPTGCRLPGPLLESVIGVLREDWELGTRLLAAAWVPDAGKELNDFVARLALESSSGPVAASLVELWERTDLREILGEIKAPTLVLHRHDDPVVAAGRGKLLAALIPGARLELLPGPWHQPWLGDTAAVLRLAGGFFGRPLTSPLGEDRRHLKSAGLTARERQVLQLVAQGLSDATIAQRLVLSAHTVHRHVANIRTRLGQPSRGAAAVFATRAGLI